MKLHLGCGTAHLKGWVNCDKEKRNKPDKIVDLDVYPYPFKDNSASIIRMHHVIEHLDNPVRCIEECHRILQKGGVLDIRVPHWMADLWGNPYHKHRFSKKYFMCFDHDAQEYKGTIGDLWYVPNYGVEVKLLFEYMKMRFVEIKVSMVKK